MITSNKCKKIMLSILELEKASWKGGFLFIIYYRMRAALHTRPFLPLYILYLRLLDPPDLLGTPAPPVRRSGVGNGTSSSLLLLSWMVNLCEAA